MPFRRDGVIILDGIFDKARIQELRTDLGRKHPEYLGKGKPDDFVEVGDNRLMAALRFAPPFDCADIYDHPVLTEMLQTLLTENFVFDSIGIIASLPGAAEQHVHRDGGFLFSETGIDRVLPASAVTVMIPLADMNSVNGSTAFWPGSHIGGEPDEDAPFVTPEIPVGSLVIWDYRLQHQGMANCGSVARPLIFLTACRPFWTDHLNFGEGRNAKLLACPSALDQLNKQTRARFARAKLTA